MKVALTTLILVVAQSALAGPRQADSASIRGVVSTLGTGEAIVGAVVELSGGEGEAPTVRTTTEGGQFTFSGIKPGTYRLVATHPSGSLNPAEYLSRTPRGRGQPLTLRAGELLDGIRLEMARTGSIAGRVLDRNGNPVGYARVLALEASWVNGRRVLRISQSTQTNDHGEYKLIWLPPGEYYVATRPQSLGRRTVPITITPPGYAASSEEAVSPVVTRRQQDDGSVVEETFPLTYLGGTTDLQRAVSLTIAPGSAISTADIALAEPVRTYSIRGRVVPGAATPLPAGASLRAIPVEPSPQIVIATGTADAQGNFEIPGVVPGAYWLFAVAGTAFNPLTPDGLTGWTRLDVGSGDVEGVRITVTKGVDLTGRIEIEGWGGASNDPIRIGLRRSPDILGMPDASVSGVPSADRTFSLIAVSPGQYELVLPTLPAGSYVKSVRRGAKDYLGIPLEIEAAQEQPLVITIGADAAAIDGQVVNARRESVANATVAMIPDIPLRTRADLYRTFTTDGEGRFTAQAIPPGRYTLLAWEIVEEGRWENLEFIGQQEGRGTALRLDPNSKASVVLQVIGNSP